LKKLGSIYFASFAEQAADKDCYLYALLILSPPVFRYTKKASTGLAEA